MKILPLVLFLASFVSSVVITYPDDAGSMHVPHLTAMFGPRPSTYSVSGVIVADYTMLCTDSSNVLGSKYLNQIVLIERGVCTFTEKALNAQALGAIGVIIGGNDNGDILGYMGSAPGYENVHIPTVYVSGQSYQKLQQILMNYGFTGESVQATLDGVGEAEGTIGFLNPPASSDSGMATGPSVDPNDPSNPSNPTDPTDPSDPTEPNNPDSGLIYYEEPTSTLTIVWIIVGLSVLVKCLIITVACRRRYLSRPSPHTAASTSSSTANGALLTEGEVSDATPVVYATYPAPSSAFTVSAASEEEGTLPAAPVAATATRTPRPLSAYPSIQYAPLMPQATAPSDVYAYDLEKQVIVIRG